MKLKFKHVIFMIFCLFSCNIFGFFYNLMIYKLTGISHTFWLAISFGLVIAIIPSLIVITFLLFEHDLDEVWLEIKRRQE